MNDSLYAEIRNLIQDRLDAGIAILAEWLTAEIIAAKDEPQSADADFYLICARNHVADVVKRCIGKYKAAPTTDEQLRLPGFEHLQKAYQVERDGERVLVPTDMLTDDEIFARAAEYDAMATGFRNHARELRGFAQQRGSSGVRAAE